jgi:hypothetical protein
VAVVSTGGAASSASALTFKASYCFRSSVYFAVAAVCSRTRSYTNNTQQTSEQPVGERSAIDEHVHQQGKRNVDPPPPPPTHTEAFMNPRARHAMKCGVSRCF